jgi:hypothetical protein
LLVLLKEYKPRNTQPLKKDSMLKRMYQKKAQGLAIAQGLLLFFLITGMVYGLIYFYASITQEQDEISKHYYETGITSDFAVTGTTTVNGNASLIFKNIGKTNLLLRTELVNPTADSGISFYGVGINSSWQYAIDINITNSGSTILNNFPVYLKIPYQTGMRNNYNDLRFSLGECAVASDARLAYELDNYTSSFAHVWLNLETFNPGTNHICMYYGYTSASSGSNSANTWNSNYVGVWHLEELYTQNQKDSSKYLSHMVPRNYDNNKDIAGIVGRAENHEGTNDFLNTTGTKMPHLRAAQTIEAWAYYTANPAGNRNIVLLSNMASSAATSFGFRSGVTLAWYWGGNAIVSWTALPTTNTWHHYVYTRNTTNNRLYVDGVLRGNTVTLPQNFMPTAANINTANWGENFLGRIDEVRISNVSRTQDWIQNSYQIISNQTNRVKFSTVQNLNWAIRDNVICFEVYANDVLLTKETDYTIVLPQNPTIKYNLLPTLDSAYLVLYKPSASQSGTLVKLVSCDGTQRYYRFD